MWRQYVLIGLLLSLGVVGIGLKMFGSEDLARSHKREIELLTRYMSARGLSLAETFALNREGSFSAHVYRHKNCDGGWIISPMYRNSEAVSLFSRQASYQNYKMGAVFYMLGHTVYPEFPELNLWLFQKIAGFKRAFHLSEGHVPPVLAFRNFGVCDAILEE